MSLHNALKEAVRFLDEQSVPYAVIGGLAVQHWAEPRATQDVDLTVLVPPEGEEVFLQRLMERFQPRIRNAKAFARRNRVALVRASNGIPLDIALGAPGYEQQVMKRAVRVGLGRGLRCRLVGAEDLIIHKCVAGRPRDAEDVERVLIRQRVKLDLRYIRRWLKRFAAVVETHDPEDLFREALRRARAGLRRDEG